MWGLEDYITRAEMHSEGVVDVTGAYQCLLELLVVVHVVHLVGSRLVEVVVVIWCGDAQILPLFLAGSFQ